MDTYEKALVVPSTTPMAGEVHEDVMHAYGGKYTDVPSRTAPLYLYALPVAIAIVEKVAHLWGGGASQHGRCCGAGDEPAWEMLWGGG